MAEKVCLLFSGQGAQKVGMGQDLFEGSAKARELYNLADSHLGWKLSQISFQGPAERLMETEVCQPALFVHGLAALAAWEEKRGARPNFVATAGLSLGEYTAHVAAGSFDFTTGLRLVSERGRLMQRACESQAGTMTTLLGASTEQARQIAQQANVDVANLNCPGQIVLSGSVDAMKAVPELAKAHGVKRAIPVSVAGAYHSRLMALAAEGLWPHLEGASIHAPEVSVIANFTAQAVLKPAEIKTTLLDQVCGSVRWEESIRLLLAQGITTFVEFGVGGVLAGLLRRIEPSATCYVVEKLEDIEKCSLGA
jgi:[acyl-carrier-protein] S-malonyltransferase